MDGNANNTEEHKAIGTSKGLWWERGAVTWRMWKVKVPFEHCPGSEEQRRSQPTKKEQSGQGEEPAESTLPRQKGDWLLK